jgi:hypothetical protein
MSSQTGECISIPVDYTNPGQFFACCGLLEVADRLWQDVEGWFQAERFLLRSQDAISLPALLGRIKECALVVLATADDSDGGEAEEEDKGDGASPMEIDLCPPRPPLRLDWWTDRALKTWAGRMSAPAILRAMRGAIDDSLADPLNYACVVRDPVADQPVDASNSKPSKSKGGKKREPFYFDARRGASAHPLDIGFAPDPLKMETAAFPVVEALCLIGLQRFRPMPTEIPRTFQYFTWSIPLEARLGSVAACGLLPLSGGQGFQFEILFRTDQRKHKAYGPATPFQRSTR